MRDREENEEMQETGRKGNTKKKIKDVNKERTQGE